MPRIVVLSDIHLSPTHGFFWDNWCIARDFAGDAAADAIVVNGDLSINGPDSDAEIEFAASALTGLRGEVLALPGNHDVGDEPPGQDPGQLVNPARLARWDDSLARDRWVCEAGEWLLLGVNSQLFGSGLEREDEQERWLDAQLAAGRNRPIGLFLHKPIFLDHPDEDEPTASCMVPAVRGRLLARLDEAGVRLVVSGHLHQHRDRIVDGIRHVWAPAVAFAAPQSLGGDPRCGLIVLDLSGDDLDVEVHRPVGLVSHDLAAIKQNGRYKFLRDMPPCPPPGETRGRIRG